MVITMAKLRMAHASTHGARKHAWRTQAAWAKTSLGNKIMNRPHARLSLHPGFFKQFNKQSCLCCCWICPWFLSLYIPYCHFMFRSPFVLVLQFSIVQLILVLVYWSFVVTTVKTGFKQIYDLG